MSTRRYLFPAFTLLAGFLASACTAILVPDETDDGVVRCNNSEDCPDTGDNRYIAQCVYGEGQPETSDKVCAADFDDIPCGGEFYNGDHPLSVAYQDALDAKAFYGSCSEENRGKRGCQPQAGGVCNDGLQIDNESGICDDPDDPIPAIFPPNVGGIDIAGQDAKDNFCRWYFCDESFVCARAGSRELCQPCVPGREFGEGGCGTLYIQGEPSPIYTPADAGNCGGDQATTEASFGPAPA